MGMAKKNYQKWKCEGGVDEEGEKPTDMTTWAPPHSGRTRILVLHGGGMSGPDMKHDQGMQDLMDATMGMVEFVFATSPQNGVWMRDPPGGKGEPTTDPAWADVAINYIDEMIENHGPFWGLLGYSQGSAFIPVYLSNRPDAHFELVMLYCGYAPSTHLGLMETLNANAPLATPAMVFSGAHDPFAFGAPEQVAVFENVQHFESNEAGHHL